MPAIVTRAEATLQADVLAAEFGESGGLRAVDAQGSVELNERPSRFGLADCGRCTPKAVHQPTNPVW